MAVIVKQVLIDGDGLDVAAQVVVVVLDQTGGQAVQADGRFHLREAQLVIGGHVLIVEGNRESGMIADAEGQLFLVPVFNGQGVVNGVIFQG